MRYQAVDIMEINMDQDSQFNPRFSGRKRWNRGWRPNHGNQGNHGDGYGQPRSPRPLRFNDTAHRKLNWFMRALNGPSRNIFKHYQIRGNMPDITGVFFGWDDKQNVNYVDIYRLNRDGVEVQDTWEWLTQVNRTPPKEDNELCAWYLSQEGSVLEDGPKE